MSIPFYRRTGERDLSQTNFRGRPSASQLSRDSVRGATPLLFSFEEAIPTTYQSEGQSIVETTNSSAMIRLNLNSIIPSGSHAVKIKRHWMIFAVDDCAALAFSIRVECAVLEQGDAMFTF